MANAHVCTCHRDRCNDKYKSNATRNKANGNDTDQTVNIAQEMDRTIHSTDRIIVIIPDHTPKAVGGHLLEHRAAITHPAHTLKDLAIAKETARITTDPIMPKEKARPRMIRVRPTEKVKAAKVKDAGGNVLDMLPQPLPTQNYLILRPYQTENNRSKNGNPRIPISNTYNGKTTRYIND